MTYEERKKWLSEQCGKPHLDAIEKQVTKEYWLFTINFDNVILNCFFDWFPSKRDLKKASKGKEYAIIHTMKLTEEQYNKLTKDE